MTIPTTLLNDSIYKTIALSREAFETRLLNNDNRFRESPAFHHGVPNPNNLPNDDLGIWLHLDQLTPDPDTPYGAEILMGRWLIHIITRDRGDDPNGFDPSHMDEVLGKVIEMLTETLEDTALDGAIEFLDLESAVSIPAQQASGGDGLVAGWELSIIAHHPMQPVRC